MAKRRVFPKGRDLTRLEFIREIESRGWQPAYFMGYVRLSNGHGSISYLNSGSDRRKEQLAYLDREFARLERKRWRLR